MSEPGRASTRALCALSAAVAVGEVDGIRQEMQRAVRACGSREIEEALLQTYLFLGFPAALEALSLWRELGGVEATGTDALAESDLVADWTDRGEKVCAAVYGDAYDKLRRNVKRIHPALDRWMVTEGYGKVLGRPGLDLAIREVCIVAILAVTGREPQLQAHLQGALNAGARPEDVDAALRTGLDRSADLGWRERADRLWTRVRERNSHRFGES